MTRAGGQGWRDRVRVPLAMVVVLLTLAPVIPSPILILAAWRSRLPASFCRETPLVADLAGPTIADQRCQFAERAERAFAVGMPVDELERTLCVQGFSPPKPYGGYGNRLHVERAICPCLMGSDVDWTSRDGMVAAARGTKTATCL